MERTITLDLPPELDQALDEFAKEQGLTFEAYVRDVVRRRVALEKFERLRAKLVPEAEAKGIHTDEDVFRLLES